MDSTLLYSLIVGIGLVFVFLAVKFAVRWIVRIAIIVLFILLMLGGAQWLLRGKLQQPQQPTAQPRSSPTRRVSIDRR
jgi:hypothetical protein